MVGLEAAVHGGGGDEISLTAVIAEARGGRCDDALPVIAAEARRRAWTATAC